MLCKRLGRTRVEIPAIVQGTSGAGSYSSYEAQRVRERIEVLKYGIDLGMTYLDTGDRYGGGLAEEIVGEVIKGRRHDIFVASKFNPRENVFSSVMSSVDGSLKRMHTDYIDLYQVHWPNPLLPLPEIMRALAALVEQGKIRFIGLSNFTLDEFREAQSCLPGHTIVSDQVEYNLIDRSAEDDLIPFCREAGVTLLAYSSLNQGRFLLKQDQEDALGRLAAKHSKTRAQIVLRWLISHGPVVAITRSMNRVHTAENAGAADFCLEEEDIREIDGVYRHPSIAVPPQRVRVRISDAAPVYTTLKEALDNPLDLIPSPLVLSRMTLKRKSMKPIRLVPTTDTSGKYDYDIDSFDVRDNVKKYWAWIIAYGDQVEMPAVLVNQKSGCLKHGR